MGAFTQRQRRSSHQPTPAAPPAVPSTILGVAVTATDTCVITFDLDPDFNGAAADGNFLVNGTGFQLVNELTPTTYELVQPFGQPPITPGDLWDLTAQLLWANNVVTNPANGVTT